MGNDVRILLIVKVTSKVLWNPVSQKLIIRTTTKKSCSVQSMSLTLSRAWSDHLLDMNEGKV